MTCHSCKQPAGPDRNYCGACGALLVHHCRGCGFRNLLSDRFCGGCGTELRAAATVLTPRFSSAPTQPTPAPGPRPEVEELLEAARAEGNAEREEASVRVNQNDIDQLFGE